MDKELLDLLDNNPDAAFRILLEKYGGLVKAICKNLLSGFSNEDIEEAVADCFAVLWLSKEKLGEINNLKSYIAGIARKKAFDKIRVKLRHEVSISIDELEIGIDVDMSSEAARNINAEIIARVINEMPIFEREVFIRRYYMYEKVKDIANIMNCPYKKVENTLYRYKEKLRAELIKGGIIL